MPILAVGVTTYQGGREGRPQGEGHRRSIGSRHAVREMRRARVALHITCRLWATGLATGERGDTETVTPCSARGDWKGHCKMVPRQSPTQLRISVRKIGDLKESTWYCA